MSVAKEQREKLIWEFPNIGKKAPEQEEKAFAYCEGYKEFLNAAKTEREFVREAVLRLKEAGYEEFEEGKIYQPGDKVYQINRKKALLMSTFGKRPLEDGVRINVAHIDSPRLDLKPNPLYEKAEAAYFKTHYYGGIRKYQWATIPLAMHGVVILKDGTSVDICIGEKESDPGPIVTVVCLQLFIGGDFTQHLAVTFGIFARDKRRHTAHRKRAAFVAGLNQQA